MIELTKEQRTSLQERRDEPPQVRDPESDTTYVLLKKETFDRIKNLLDENNAADQWTAFLAAAGDEWDDPALDVYNQYRNKK